MEIKINIKKKDLFLISAIVVFLVGVGVVMSYNAVGTDGKPAVMGHSVDEIAGVQKQIIPVGTQCTPGNSIRIINADGTVICELDDNTPADGHGTFNCVAATGKYLSCPPNYFRLVREEKSDFTQSIYSCCGVV